nr:E3 SUMO-protein ligase SIZ1-like isoform X3 [Ipomoea batatas]
MDLVGSCKDKLAYFRIKELKDVLTQIGVSKQGKKQDLVDRILTILSDDRGKEAGQRRMLLARNRWQKLWMIFTENRKPLEHLIWHQNRKDSQIVAVQGLKMK